MVICCNEPLQNPPKSDTITRNRYSIIVASFDLLGVRLKIKTILLLTLTIFILLAGCAPAPLTADQVPGALPPSASNPISVQRLAWLADGTSVLAGNGSSLLWLDPVNLTEQDRLELGEPVEGLLVNPAGDQLLVLIDPARALVVDLALRQVSLTPEAWREITNFCPPAQSLDVVNFQNAYCGTDALKTAVKAANKKWQKAIRGGGTVERIAPDGSAWALGLGGISEATSWLVDLESKELRYKFIVEGGDIVSVNGALALAFAPDSRTLAMADLSGLVTLWDVTSGERLETFASGELAIDLAFSPDGRTIAMSSKEKVLLFSR